jgi:hypothetical protein
MTSVNAKRTQGAAAHDDAIDAEKDQEERK